MPEIINDRKIYSLLEVSASIRKTLAKRYTSAFWVKAEMNKLNLYPQSGHCYPELVEKKDGRVVAELKANLWKDEYTRINSQFLKTIKEPLRDGIKILFLGMICFDAVYGLSLKILDIDPNYTLGDLEKERRETIDQLKREGVYESNRRLPLALLPQRIAIISDQSSKGYADFRTVIDNNPWGYRIFCMLFPSLLQGERSVASIIQQLKRIRSVRHHFDAVAIIRGGGGDVGLSSFNRYALCKEITSFPIPVLTGIGHSTNETVAELVAHSNQITPTKLAEFIIQRFHNYAIPVQKAQEKIVEQALRMMRDANKDLATQQRILVQQANNIARTARTALSTKREQLKSSSERQVVIAHQSLKMNMQLMKKDVKGQLQSFGHLVNQRASSLMSGVQNVINTNRRMHDLQYSLMTAASKRMLSNMATRIADAEKNVINMSPEKVLKRGFSITLFNGKAVKNSEEIKAGEIIETILYKGRIISTIKEKTNE